MSLTRAKVEQELVVRCRPLLTAAGMAITYGGTNASLNSSIGYAIRKLNGTTTDPLSVTDTDVATVADDDFDALFDVAELRTLETILGNWDKVDTTVGPTSERLSQTGASLEARIARLQAKIDKEYQLTGGTIGTGMIGYDFAEHDEALPEESE